MTSKSDLKALEALRASRGWAITRERMEAEVVEAALLIGKSGAMTTDEIHFRRGSIWAAQQLLQLPERLIALIQSQSPFETDVDDRVPAPPLQPKSDT